MDCASSSRRSFWKTRRGWRGLASMASIGTVRSAASTATGAGGGACVRLPSSVFMPLPSALRGFSVLFMVEDLFGESNVAFGAAGTGVIAQDRLTEAGGLG